MCGRFQLNAHEIEELEKIVEELNEKHAAFKEGDVFPSDRAAVLRADENGEVIADSMPWGFHGFKKGQLIINARSETVTEKRMFASAFKMNRCVFPTTGFYEWSKDKSKYLLTRSDSNVLYIAGFYKTFKEDGNRSIILTTESISSVISIHDRMPLILEKSQISTWLSVPNFAYKVLSESLPEPLLEKESA